MLLGLLRPTTGTVSSRGERLLDLDRRDIARRMAFVPQETRSDFAFTVRELVAMGRMPHLGRFEPEGDADRAAIEEALVATETRAFESRLISELSGGERQRVHIARAIAQTTEVLLLDEPTSNLDVAHQLDVMHMIRKLVRSGKGVAVALHDLSLAARFADRIVVLSRVVWSSPRERPEAGADSGASRGALPYPRPYRKGSGGTATILVVPLAALPTDPALATVTSAAPDPETANAAARQAREARSARYLMMCGPYSANAAASVL